MKVGVLVGIILAKRCRTKSAETPQITDYPGISSTSCKAGEFKCEGKNFLVCSIEGWKIQNTFEVDAETVLGNYYCKKPSTESSAPIEIKNTGSYDISSLTPKVFNINRGNCHKAQNLPEGGIFAHNSYDLSYISYGHGASGLGCSPGVTINGDGSLSEDMKLFYQKVKGAYPNIGGWLGKCGQTVQVPGTNEMVLIVDEPHSGMLELSPNLHWKIFKDNISFNLCSDCIC